MTPHSSQNGIANTVATAARLSGRHRDDLAASGLAPETIAAAGLYTETNATRISEALGWQYPAKKIGNCLAFPFYTATGERIAAYLRLKPDNPLADRKYESPKGQPNRAYFPPLPALHAALADPLAPLFVTEGEKKSLAATQYGFPCIGLVGVDGWNAKRERNADGKARGKKKLLPDLAALKWDGRLVYIVYDSDAATKPDVLRAEYELASALRDAGAVVKIVRLPNEPDGVKNGLDDFLVRYGSGRFRELVAVACDPQAPAEQIKRQAERGGLPTGMVLIRPNEYEVIDEVTALLAQKDNELYQRGGKLVRVMRSAKLAGKRDRVQRSGGLQIVEVPLPDLRARITRHCRIMRTSGENIVEDSPPSWLVAGIEAQAAPWIGVRPLEAVSETPLLRPDGTILQEPGYDAETGILYEPATFEKIPTHPTHDDAIRARDELLEVVTDFPFAKPMHKAAWLASVLTPLARPAFDGPAPLFFIDANIRAAGKGLLADCAVIIATGRPFARAIYSHDPIEMRKIVTSIALAGETVVMLDNVAGTFGNSALDAALTSTDWGDRLLSTNDKPRLPLFCTWYATGNNCVIGADTPRRICHIRLESPLERPEERDDMQHPDLLAWVRAEQPRLLRAALTILAAYCAAGRPQTRLKPWGSFEAWSALIRQAVVWLDLPDPADTRLTLCEEADAGVILLRALMAAFAAVVPDGESARAATVLQRLQNGSSELQPHHDALLTLMPSRDSMPTARQLGNALKRYKGRFLDGRCFSERLDRKGFCEWRLSGNVPSLPTLAESVPTVSARESAKMDYAHAHANGAKTESADSADSAFDLAADEHGDAWEGSENACKTHEKAAERLQSQPQTLHLLRLLHPSP